MSDTFNLNSHREWLRRAVGHPLLFCAFGPGQGREYHYGSIKDAGDVGNALVAFHTDVDCVRLSVDNSAAIIWAERASSLMPDGEVASIVVSPSRFKANPALYLAALDEMRQWQTRRFGARPPVLTRVLHALFGVLDT